MGDSGNDIIIKGGSVEIEFDPALYVRDNDDPKMRKYKGPLRIKRIVIEGDGKFNDYSTDVPENYQGQIRIVCE